MPDLVSQYLLSIFFTSSSTNPTNLFSATSVGFHIDQDTYSIMVPTQTLVAIKGGGGSIKVGTTGTINALMSRELQSVKVASNEAATGTTSKAKVQTDEASTSGSNNTMNKMKMNEKHTSIDQKSKHHHAREDSRNPFLRSESVCVDGNETNNKRKNDKKGSCIVEIVDVKCSVSDKMWANPITNRLKKLTFAKLSDPNGVK